jgi:hypothetical protein
LRPEDLQPEDRFCDPKGAFQNSVPPKAIDPLYVKAGKPCQRLKGANKNEIGDIALLAFFNRKDKSPPRL